MNESGGGGVGGGGGNQIGGDGGDRKRPHLGSSFSNLPVRRANNITSRVFSEIFKAPSSSNSTSNKK
ncbi:hypothetical protein CsSME_00003010 [Camellia sinensis var. sinensis]